MTSLSGTEFINDGVSESRFSMWRAVFAMAHADGIVTKEEKELLEEFLSYAGFSEIQKRVLARDIEKPQIVGEMYEQITNPADRDEFFYYARLMVWCDGDFASQEQDIIDKMKKFNIEITRNQIERINNSVKKNEQEEKAENSAERNHRHFWEMIRRSLGKKGDGI